MRDDEYCRGYEGSASCTEVRVFVGFVARDGVVSPSLRSSLILTFLRSAGFALTTTERVVSVTVDMWGAIGRDGGRILGVATRVDGVPGSEYNLVESLSSVRTLSLKR